ncbi:unnamed protein product [Closterium sp. NIES-65]|nr:unnamed protein product [Closterium sp. NIES-65]
MVQAGFSNRVLILASSTFRRCDPATDVKGLQLGTSQVHISGLHPTIDSHPPAPTAAALPIPPSARPSLSSASCPSPSLSESPAIRPTITSSASASHSSLLNSTSFSLNRSSLTSLIGAHGKEPFLIGVSGGTASGKTTVCEQIIQQLHDHRVVLVHQDSFYRGLTEEELKHASDFNFDHPDAFDTDALLSTIVALKEGQSVEIPVLEVEELSNAVRKSEQGKIVEAEGLKCTGELQAAEAGQGGDLLGLFRETSAVVDVELPQTRQPIARVLKEILQVLGPIRVSLQIDVQGVIDQVRVIITRDIDQYARFVKPAFDDFVLPSKKFADIIIPRGGDNHVAVNLIVQHIGSKLGQHDLRKIYSNVHVIESTFQVRGMHTLIRNRDTKKHNFVFYADRLIRLLVEHGLGHLPFTEIQVTTPTGSTYVGINFSKKLCGVSIIRSGESMENALRACCKGVKIGKILIHREGDYGKQGVKMDRTPIHRDGDFGKQLIYEKLPRDIAQRHVMLLDPVLASGRSAIKAIELLLHRGVPEERIIFLNLISAPEGIHNVCRRFPHLKIVTSEIDSGINEEYRVVPGMGEFGDRYFGTEEGDAGRDDERDGDGDAFEAS